MEAEPVGSTTTRGNLHPYHHKLRFADVPGSLLIRYACGIKRCTFSFTAPSHTRILSEILGATARYLITRRMHDLAMYLLRSAESGLSQDVRTVSLHCIIPKVNVEPVLTNRHRDIHVAASSLQVAWVRFTQVAHRTGHFPPLCGTLRLQEFRNMIHYNPPSSLRLDRVVAHHGGFKKTIYQRSARKFVRKEGPNRLRIQA